MTWTIGVTAIIALLIFTSIKLYIQNVDLKEVVQMFQTDLINMREDLKAADMRYRSATIKFGQFYEKTFPWLSKHDINPNELHYLGDPIDYIAFTKDHIIFIEIKTGNSRLTKSQQLVREHVRSNNVLFIEERYNDAEAISN